MTTHTQSRRSARSVVGVLRGRWDNAEPFAAPPRSEWPLALRRARTFGLILLAIQFVAFCWWSSVLTHHLALTWDFAAYEQAASLIAHGHLNPYSTVLGSNFARNDYEFLIWLLAPFQRLWPHPMTLKVLQALAMVGAEAVALDWMSDIAAVRFKRDGRLESAVSLMALGTLLLVVNPWIVWTISFDVHTEPFITLFVVAAARDLYRGRRRAWVWLAFCLVCGAAAAAYVDALAISAILSGRCWWRQGVAMLVIATVWTEALAAVIGTNTNGLAVYILVTTGHLGRQPKDLSGALVVKDILKHPGRDLQLLWGNRLNIWGNLSPAGLIGLFWLPLTIPIVVITLLSELTGYVVGFGFPGFQNVALEVLVAVGTIALCSALAGRFVERRSWVPRFVFALLAVNAVTWAAFWLPETHARWLPNDPSNAEATIVSLRDRIGPDDEVVAENGVTGAFAEDRRYMYTLRYLPATFPVHTHRVWLIFAPDYGIEPKASIAEVEEDIGIVANYRGMHLVTARNGVWAFEWNPPKGTMKLRIGSPSGGASASSLAPPAWILAGPAGVPVRRGAPSDWYVASTVKPGYVVARGYTLELPGTYVADVSLSASSLVKLELWDATTSTLLARQVLRRTRGRITVSLTARLLHAPGNKVFSGWGPWSTRPSPPVPGDDLELRVWSDGGSGRVKVYSASVTRVSDRT